VEPKQPSTEAIANPSNEQLKRRISRSSAAKDCHVFPAVLSVFALMGYLIPLGSAIDLQAKVNTLT
jgi:hypothetical protein